MVLEQVTLGRAKGSNFELTFSDRAQEKGHKYAAELLSCWCLLERENVNRADSETQGILVGHKPRKERSMSSSLLSFKLPEESPTGHTWASCLLGLVSS
jgi:hypothetical protein